MSNIFRVLVRGLNLDWLDPLKHPLSSSVTISPSRFAVQFNVASSVASGGNPLQMLPRLETKRHRSPGVMLASERKPSNFDSYIGTGRDRKYSKGAPVLWTEVLGGHE